MRKKPEEEPILICVTLESEIIESLLSITVYYMKVQLWNQEISLVLTWSLQLEVGHQAGSSRSRGQDHWALKSRIFRRNIFWLFLHLNSWTSETYCSMCIKQISHLQRAINLVSLAITFIDILLILLTARCHIFVSAGIYSVYALNWAVRNREGP